MKNKNIGKNIKNRIKNLKFILMSQPSKRPKKESSRSPSRERSSGNENPLYGMDFDEALKKIVTSPKIKKQAGK